MDGRIVQLIDSIIIEAFNKGASDIHFEPKPNKNEFLVRIRVDGICALFKELPLKLTRAVISRIKIMASLDISEKRLPQDGKIKFEHDDVSEFEMRVATLPTTGGYEDVVLRILDQANALPLDKLGMRDRDLGTLRQLVAQPHGLILVVGPTGSGKTTTLHSALKYINAPNIKIWTAEDPVEITQDGLRQVEAKPGIGLDFARVMRAFLRADPDVIMIGEMRDRETAAIALEASLTGHLVLSTLHTNSAAETVTRILDMGLNPIYASDALLCVLAQRLVRTLCSDCREEYEPTEEEVSQVVFEYGEEAFTRVASDVDELNFSQAIGCDKCNETGYRGRVAITELLENTEEIEKLIKKGASTDLILKEAIEEGMTTLKQDGILKVIKGLTTMEEVRRVCIR